MPSQYQIVSCSLTDCGRSCSSVSPLLYETSIHLCSYRLHNFHTQHTTICGSSPHFLSPPPRIQLQFIVCNVCQTQMPFSLTTTVVLSVGWSCTYTHVHNKHHCCYLSNFTLLSLFWNEKKKNVGHYFLSTLCRNVQILKLKFNSDIQARLNKNKNVHSNPHSFSTCLLIQICSHTDRVTGSPYRWRSCQDAFSTARICDIKKFNSAVLTSCSQLILMGWAPIQPMNLKDKRKTCQDCMPNKNTK